MSDVVKRDLYGLIDKELEAANQKFRFLIPHMKPSR